MTNTSNTISGWRSAAEVAGVTVSRLRRIVERGDLHAKPGKGGAYLFPRSDLEALRVLD